MDLKLFPFAEFNNTSYVLDGLKAIRIFGADSKRFLNGQLTSNVDDLDCACFQESARLDRGGRLKSFFILGRVEEEEYLAIGEASLIAFLKEDLEKYIIMDDVELMELEGDKSVYQINFSFASHVEGIFRGQWAALPAFITNKKNINSFRTLADSDYEKLMLLRGGALLDVNTMIDQLVTDTVLNLTGVSHDKGCYLGQESVSKIETRRGGAYFPILIESDASFPKLNNDRGSNIEISGKKIGKYLAKTEIEEKNFILVSAMRKYRVDKMKIDWDGVMSTVHYLPLGGEFSLTDYVEDLYSEAVNYFHGFGARAALGKFKDILALNSNHEDTLETIGVIYGQLGDYQKGIELMDEVLKTNSDSVMAHTNKSLFYMKLGMIDEAEEEKAQATVKSFSFFGKEAAAKRIQEEDLENERKEIERRELMFLQVLEIDAGDTLANFGMADISFKKKMYTDAKEYLLKVIKSNKEYSVAYALLGKTYIKLEKKEDAFKVLRNGILVASNQGDLMPANEMQRLINELES